MELYIDSDKESGEGNKLIIDKLQAHQDLIEQGFGNQLDWESLEGRRACRIRNVISIGGWQDENTWSEVHEALIEAMIRLERALRPFLNKL